MTPLKLRRDLSKELMAILEHSNFKNQSGEEGKIKVFEQNLPIQLNDKDTEPYPYLLVRITDGEIPENEKEYTIAINIMIGIYNNNVDAQGEDIVLNIIQDVLERFRKNPILDRKFIMQEKVKWALQDEQTHPYYFGGLLTYWTVPLIQREDIYT
ncbi:hypothetical protein [Lachnotalea glycerini]|uniref:Uncharacterized protein n=1 Tax=Lachnotalea glycerini TaxID=1763509 RepID=A0A371J7H0_9FIRM|nr:hypothetical protein [Lachnotalea glycerini]RDY28653.1 hypothetical protein CG710_019285 [Lachnotalea glycerini]